MKKIFSLLIIGIMLLAVTVVAQEVNSEKKVEDLVKDVAIKKGVNESDIGSIKEVDMNNLPEKVNIKTIDKTNLALYEVNVSSEESPVYIVTASSQLFEETIQKYAQRMLLTFGFNSEASSTTFLKTASGVTTSLQKGYVMTRDGAITGLSTNLEIVQNPSNEPITIKVYKNSKEIYFKNEFYESKSGIYNDYDSVNAAILNFEKGDLISLEINLPEDAKVKDITSLLEIQTN